MEIKTHIPILNRLFVSFVLDNDYTIESLEELHDTEIQPSEFFRNFNTDKIHSLDSLTVLLNTILNDKDSPSFELEPKINSFYSILTPYERKALHNFYIESCIFYAPKLDFTFEPEEDKIPKDLSKFIYFNSVNFFDEFDLSDGFIDVEYLLELIDKYSNNFKFDLNQLSVF